MRYHWQVVKSDWLAALAWLFLLAVELFDQHVYKLFMREKKKAKTSQIGQLVLQEPINLQ